MENTRYTNVKLNLILALALKSVSGLYFVHDERSVTDYHVTCIFP